MNRDPEKKSVGISERRTPRSTAVAAFSESGYVTRAGRRIGWIVLPSLKLIFVHSAKETTTIHVLKKNPKNESTSHTCSIHMNRPERCKELLKVVQCL